MHQQQISPVIIVPDQPACALKRLPRLHTRFNEHALQELLANHPELLPVQALRNDIGVLLCVGREVAVPSGIIDNLYLSTDGCPVIVETKLWRNPQARREVLSQTLDYVKDIVQKDFDWFEQQWSVHCSRQNREASELLSELNRLSEEEINPSFVVDGVNRALARGDVIAMIVGDGIETRLQELVSHLCRDSSHLRYSLALVEMGCYEIGRENSNEILVVPRIVQDVEPIERAYVRIDVSEALKKKVEVSSVVRPDTNKKRNVRVTLKEEDFLLSVQETAGRKCADQMKQFYDELINDFGLEPEFKVSSVMLKLPNPDGDSAGASILGLEKKGRAFNIMYLKEQLVSWGLDKEISRKITKEYWSGLNKIDSRFNADGIRHMNTNEFVPFQELTGKLPEIKTQIGKVVATIQSAYEESR